MRHIALLWFVGAGAAFAASHFSFEAVEFEPAERRLPEARAFVARVAAPGTPLPEAIRAIRHAGAACRPKTGGITECIASRPIQHSDDGERLGDITWTVRLFPGPAGRIAGADVERTHAGL